MTRIHTLEVGGFDHNFSYLIESDTASAIIDPTGNPDCITAALDALPHAPLKSILLTHWHGDHTENLSLLCRLYPDAVVYAGDAKGKTRTAYTRLFNHQMIPVGCDYCEAIFTPGHTPESICYRLSAPDALFTGDTLFIGCCGYCEPRTMYRTMRNVLYELPDTLEVYPGHDYGPVPHATLGEEKRTNPYLKAATFAEFEAALKDL